ncbi:hypothetical protein EPUS_06723 [Endocarpon pusillum Z07020]|uniref:BTB domain-containing protein n=1 Tax=Endocarpon pusillum (strain Z07020 / HMAS-L-300199) TaxID=1263415 RepID=U1GFP9_ENDPU|nr:uncharacterized protein EPUS_06723 [Endocarpon pusillum Z07020]ERF70938.1 hypothetical protein EPUS_06723 [Endocarpon pusillum Z07020]
MFPSSGRVQTDTPAQSPPPVRNVFGGHLNIAYNQPAESVFASAKEYASAPASAPGSNNFRFPTQGPAKKQGNDLKATQHDLFNKEKYSDMTIKCKTREWKCHRAILCPRCPFFEAACGGQFTEASTREIDLSCDDENALGIMLQYLYTYEILNHGLTTATSFQLFILGDKYELEEIRDTGMQNLSKEITNLTAADGQWAAEWYPQISQLQQRGAEKLKGQLANAIAKHAREMIKHENVRELVASDGALAVLLVEKLANPPSAMFGLSNDVPAFSNWLGNQGASPSVPESQTLNLAYCHITNESGYLVWRIAGIDRYGNIAGTELSWLSGGSGTLAPATA